MFTRRDRDLRPEKTEPAPFATKAKDLGALRDAVVDAASVGAGLWISYLFALFYFAIATGAVTHRDLLLQNPVKLPFLNVELPLKAFFILAPLVFLIVHAYVLLHFVFLANKIGAFHLELQAQIPGDDARARLRRQLPSNIFVQSLAGPREVRVGTIGFLLRRIIEISLVAGPIGLLILFQLQFLPYHSEWITSWQRIAVVIDLVLLWLLWPRIARGETAWLGRSDFQRVKAWALLLVSILPILLVVTIATFPGEWLEEHLPPVRLIPTTWAAWSLPSVQAIQTAGSGWATLHELMVAGEVNFVTGRPRSLWSNVLVLPNFEVGDRVKVDADGKITVSSDALSLRGRSLEGAVLVLAHLRKADFTGAQLSRANFRNADLREAKFECDRISESFSLNEEEDEKYKICAQLQGTNFASAQLQGASFVGAHAQGANFNIAQLQGAAFDQAQLQGAELDNARLQGASFVRAQLHGVQAQFAGLQGASLYDTPLYGANLLGAQLQGAVLAFASLQGAILSEAHLEGAFLSRVFVWRTVPPPDANRAFIDGPEPEPKYWGSAPPCAGFNGVAFNFSCDWTKTSYAALKAIIENNVPSGSGRDRALATIMILGQPPYVADEASVEAWRSLAESARSAGTYFNTLAGWLKEVGCSAAGAPYVISGLLRQGPENDGTMLLEVGFQRGHPAQEAEVATAFLDETKCPGARGLSEENKVKLQQIRSRTLSAPPGPGTAAR